MAATGPDRRIDGNSAGLPKALAPDLERALLTIRVSRAVLIEKPEAQQ